MVMYLYKVHEKASNTVLLEILSSKHGDKEAADHPQFQLSTAQDGASELISNVVILAF